MRKHSEESNRSNSLYSQESVVEPTRNDQDLSLLHLVDEAVCPIDPSRPVALEVVQEWLWFPDALFGFLENRLAQGIDALEFLSIVPFPVEIIFVGRIRERNFHC